MKFTISNEQLLVLVARMHSALNEKSRAQLAIRVEDNAARFSFTDRALAIYCTLDCQVKKEGTVFVPAKFFINILRELPPGEVELSASDAQLVINAANCFTMKLPLIKELSWRDAPLVEGLEVQAELSAAKLAYMIEQVQFCISHESSRNYATVGFFQKAGSTSLRLVGTDGFRLSCCDIVSDAALPADFLDEGICLSKRALVELARICQEGHDSVKLSLSKDRTTFKAAAPGMELYVLLSAANYPDYEGVLPKSSTVHAAVERGLLLSVSKRVLLAAGKARSIQLSFEEQNLTLCSKTVGSYEGKENISMPEYRGGECRLTLNGRFLTDVLSTAQSGALEFSFKDDEDPILIVPKNEPSGCQSKHVLVPIREGGES